MKMIAKEFPGAIIVFATLRRKLSEKEKKALRFIAERGRKLTIANRQQNPTLILTGDELFSTWWPPENWKTQGDKYSRFCGPHVMRDIKTLCEITQQVHLDMDSWGEWYSKRRKQEESKRLIGNKNVPQNTQELLKGTNANGI